MILSKQQQQRNITPDHFVIKRTAEPCIWNVYIVAEVLENGYTICNFLAPVLQDMSKLKKESFTKGFLVRTDELIPSYIVGLHVINPAFEIDMMLQKGIQPEQLPERLIPYYEFYLQQADEIELQMPENSPHSSGNSDFSALSDSAISETHATKNNQTQPNATENNQTQPKTTENNLVENYEEMDGEHE